MKKGVFGKNPKSSISRENFGILKKEYHAKLPVKKVNTFLFVDNDCSKVGNIIHIDYRKKEVTSKNECYSL